MAAITTMAAIGIWAMTTARISYVVTYGVSMNPVYHAGDLVIVARNDSYEVGQIAAYYGASGKVKVLHRIIGGDADSGYVFQGDNNPSVDPLKPTADELIGRAVVHVPKVGAWLQPLLSSTGLGVIGFLFATGSAARINSRRDIPRGRRKKKVKGMSSQGGSWAVAAAAVKAVSRLHPALRALAVLAAICGLLGFGLGILGWMKPTSETVLRSGVEGESMAFSYSAKVPRTAAYDGTTVYAPEPVYRNLANIVDLTMAYQGAPGRIEVRARLSSASGWHSTMQLSQPRQFTASRYTDTIQLDLNAFDKKAQAASEAIGVDVGAVSVAITAHIKHNNGSVFEPAISFGLVPLQLTLTGGAQSLLVDHSSVAAGTSLQPRQIGAFGYDLLLATQARKYAVYLLLIAALVGGAIAMTALRHVPLNTRAQILRRYPHLLVPVEPMPSPPGKPVVIVDSFPALVKLAEKYGQMILTWTRPDGADDFVVRDDGVTYRYRILPPNHTPAPDADLKPAAARKPAARKATGVAKAVPLPPPPPPPVKSALEQPAPEPKPAPAKRARRPRKQAAPTPDPSATPETPGAAGTKPEPPLKRPLRPNPEAAREAMESLAELNQPLEKKAEPIYDFLPAAKHAAPEPNDRSNDMPKDRSADEPKDKDQADGVTGR